MNDESSSSLLGHALCGQYLLRSWVTFPLSSPFSFPLILSFTPFLVHRYLTTRIRNAFRQFLLHCNALVFATSSVSLMFSHFSVRT